MKVSRFLRKSGGMNMENENKLAFFISWSRVRIFIHAVVYETVCRKERLGNQEWVQSP